MANSMSSKGVRLYQPRFVAKWLRRDAPPPDAFDCGVRVTDGAFDGLGPKFRHKPGWADPLVLDGVVSLVHDQRTLRLRVEQPVVPHPKTERSRLGYVVFPAEEQATGARLEITVMAYELERFGL